MSEVAAAATLLVPAPPGKASATRPRTPAIANKRAPHRAATAPEPRSRQTDEGAHDRAARWVPVVRRARALRRPPANRASPPQLPVEARRSAAIVRESVGVAPPG